MSDPFIEKYAIPARWAHVLATKMEWSAEGAKDLIYIESRVTHETLGDCYVGWFVCGIGLYNVHFPVGEVRACTPEEVERWTSNPIRSTFADPCWLKREDFAVES